MSKDKKTKKIKRQLKGVIVSDKMTKTAVVKVDRLKFHPYYKKYYRVSKKFKAENPNNQYKEGQRVIIEASRPLSKEKRWIIKGLA